MSKVTVSLPSLRQQSCSKRFGTKFGAQTSLPKLNDKIHEPIFDSECLAAQKFAMDGELKKLQAEVKILRDEWARIAQQANDDNAVEVEIGKRSDPIGAKVAEDVYALSSRLKELTKVHDELSDQRDYLMKFFSEDSLNKSRKEVVAERHLITMNRLELADLREQLQAEKKELENQEYQTAINNHDSNKQRIAELNEQLKLLRAEEKETSKKIEEVNKPPAKTTEQLLEETKAELKIVQHQKFVRNKQIHDLEAENAMEIILLENARARKMIDQKSVMNSSRYKH